MSTPAAHVELFGDGPRLFVGIHGWGSEHRKSFSDVLAHLPDDVTFAGVDLPGCGLTPKLDAMSFEAVNASVAEAIRGLGRPATIIGSCAGSYHALPVARALGPELAPRLVLLEPFAYMPWFFSVFVTPVTGKLLYKMVFDNPIGQHLTQASLRRQHVSQGFDMVGAFAKNDLKVAYSYLEYYAAIPHHSTFADVQGQVRMITGESSWAAIRESIPMWRENWPEAESWVIGGAGHMFNQEAPARAAQAIFDPSFSPGRDAHI